MTAGETAPIELSQCDACGQRMPAAHLRTVWSAGCETAACRACMGEEEDGVCPCGWPYEYETSTHQEGHGEWVTEERPWCPRCDAEPERVPSEPAPFDDSEIPY